ncbi:uracil-DNA glycosylase family protein [Xanthomonas sp. NCPPB 2654]|uniref:uracil-DNA glycosylase family protein n=1 Tax=unclassified Xanthomonas TaxID=2643310 RepID=UPI0021E0AC18|nr:MULTISPECIES: uracil-DNA glycosylase family protein [unclassified Xanthomonas]MDL5367581.1 uracil-DNA glycosylase family protein [Xanthomonas sp. NCPPB 2654]UYC21235.1 uracil-DNA glycosylase family protein [Xanthomonas sp. CFBP 8443]
MALDPDLHAQFRELAAQTDGIDTKVYADYAKDPLEPIVGLGRRNARLCFFGRDPGRSEVEHGEPFVGSGGQLVRKALYRHLHDGQPMPDFAASLKIGRDFFWINTVPYKPLGNKAWSMQVKRRFHPLMRRLLIEQWRGRDIVTLGREAFLWFGIDQPKQVRAQLDAFWADDARFSASIEVDLQTERGTSRRFALHPLPHPSPLNQTWFKRFPALLEARLRQLSV